MIQKTGINERELFSSKIGIRKDKTFYTKHGDLAGEISLYFSAFLILTGLILKFSGMMFRKKAIQELQ
jgi:hypothetical protein